MYYSELGATASGDPHYWTFDGRYYTVTVVGDFTLFKAGSEIFQIQGRLARVPWRASTTKAIAFGRPGHYGYQVCNFVAQRPVEINRYPQKSELRE